MKPKISKAVVKRIKVKASCIIRNNTNKSHLLRKKSSQRLRKLSIPNKLIKTQIHKLRRMNSHIKLIKTFYKSKKQNRLSYFDFNNFDYSIYTIL